MIETIVSNKNYRQISHIVIDETTYQNVRNYQYKNIVFCHANFVPFFFNEIRSLDISVILITHGSDYQVNNREPVINSDGRLSIHNFTHDGKLIMLEGETPLLFRLKPPQVKKWFAQNVNFNHPDLIPIPLGLLDNQFQNLPQKTSKVLDKIYVNFTLTYHTRNTAKEFFKKYNNGYTPENKLKPEEYLEDLNKYLFVASPRGNGIDTHRIWESLCVGSIPIVEKHPMYDSYDLPIWQISHWEEILDKNKIDQWVDSYNSGQSHKNLDQLTINYWKEKIYLEFKKL